MRGKIKVPQELSIEDHLKLIEKSEYLFPRQAQLLLGGVSRYWLHRYCRKYGIIRNSDNCYKKSDILRIKSGRAEGMPIRKKSKK